MEKELGLSASLRDVFRYPTVRLLTRQNAPEPVAAELTEIHQPSGLQRKPPLIVLPGVFGDVSEWEEFFSGQGFDRSVYGIRIVGDEPYWKPYPTVEEIASEFVRLFQNFDRRPFHMLGHSFGGCLAYELSRQLHGTPAEATSTVLVDSRGPGHPKGPILHDVSSMVRNFPLWIRNEVQVYGPLDLIHRARRKTKFMLTRRFASKGNDSNKVERIFDLKNYPSLYQDRLKQSYSAIRRYRYLPTAGRVVYLRSRVRNLVHRYSKFGGWDTVVEPEKLWVRTIPGDHGKPLFKKWHLEFAKALGESLDSVEESVGNAEAARSKS